MQPLSSTSPLLPVHFFCNVILSRSFYKWPPVLWTHLWTQRKCNINEQKKVHTSLCVASFVPFVQDGSCASLCGEKTCKIHWWRGHWWPLMGHNLASQKTVNGSSWLSWRGLCKATGKSCLLHSLMLRMETYVVPFCVKALKEVSSPKLTLND